MAPQPLAFGPFVLDLRRGVLLREGRPLAAGHRGLSLLHALLQAPGQVSTLFGDARASMDRHDWKQVMSMREATDSALLTYEKGGRAAVLSFNDDRSGGVTINVQLREDVH